MNRQVLLSAEIAVEPNHPSRQYRPLAPVAASVCMGLVADRFALSLCDASRAWHWWVAAATALSVASIAQVHTRRRLAVCLLLLSVLLVSATWSRLRWQWFPCHDLGRFATDEPVPACIDATLEQAPIVSPAPEPDPLRGSPLGVMSEAVVRVAAIRDGRTWREASGKVQLRVAGELCNLAPGDRLRIFGQLGRPRSALNPGQYDWAATERTARRLCSLYCADPRCVAVVSSAPTSALRRGVAQLRRWSERQLSASMGAEQVRLPLAVLLGARDQLPDETIEAFRQTGTIHLLVVSGLHVGMIGGIVWLAAGATGASLRVRVVVTLAIILVYAAMVGAHPPVIRATALTALFMTGLASGRRATQLNLLAAALIVVFAYNPAELERSGTQLSFLSVAALMLWGGWLKKWKRTDPLRMLLIQRAPWPRKLLHHSACYMGFLAGASLVVWLAASPLIAFHYNIAAPIGVLVAPVISPLVAIALASGLGAVTLGWLAEPISLGCGTLCGGSLDLTRQVVEWANTIPWGYFYTAGPQWWWVSGWYAAGAVFSLVPRLRPQRVVLAGLACFWIAASLAADGWRRTQRNDELTCTFLSVGHGACVVLQLPGNQTVLYDAGSLGSPEGAARTIASFLWSRRIDHIDAVVISHADIDHYNAVPRLLERMPIDVVYVSPMMFDPLASGGLESGPEYLRDTLRARDIPMREIWMGDRLRSAADSVQIDVLHPPEFGFLGRDNANSLVVAASFAGRRILLPGDLESPGLEAVTADPPFDCDILLAPHHGSAASDPPGFADWCTPQWVVLSGGSRTAGTAATADSYENAGATALHTSTAGAVAFDISREGVDVRTFCGISASN